MTRTIFFALTMFLCTMGSIFGPSASGEMPNILWLSTEDIGPHLGSYGDPDALTPTLDRLAARGIRYTRAFTVAPVCAPNRSCIITGVYPATLGTHHMRSGGEGLDRSIKPALPPEVKFFTEYLRDAGYYATNNAKEDYNSNRPAKAWDESSSSAHWRNRPESDTPFFAVFNYQGTHEGSVRANPRRYADLTQRLRAEERRDPKVITLPPYHPDTPVVRRQWANYHELITGMDYWVADRLNELEEDGLADDTIVFFWSDHGAGLPRNKRWLYDSGVQVPLIVFVPEKWREKLGIGPSGPDNRLVSSIDFAPTVLNLLGMDLPDYMQGRPFLGHDQPAPRSYVYAGRDRMDERYDMVRMVRGERFQYIRNYEPFKPYLQFMNTAAKSPVQREIARLIAANDLPPSVNWAIAAQKPTEELYDVQRDPYEMNNLAGDPQYAADLDRLRKEHEAWFERTHDLGLIPEAELVRLDRKFGSRYAIAEGVAKDAPTYLKDLRRVASLAGAPEEGDRAALEDALQSAHAPVRYWAATGLGNLDDGEETTHRMLTLALADPSPTVRVAAALARCRVGPNVSRAVETLIRELASDQEWVRLQAALALDTIGERAREAVPALQAALEDRENKYVVRVANHALNELLGTTNEVR